MKDDFQHVLKFRMDDMEWLGLMEKTDVEPGYRVTEFGNDFLCSHPHPRILCEALERLDAFAKKRASSCGSQCGRRRH
jgi:hypothetical protein